MSAAPVTRRVSTALLEAARRRADELLADPATCDAWHRVCEFEDLVLRTDYDWIVAFLLWDAAGRDMRALLSRREKR